MRTFEQHKQDVAKLQSLMNELRRGAPDASGKEMFHRLGKRVLKQLAAQIVCDKSFEVRSCKGGPAVPGEVILHTERLYMQIVVNYGHGEIMYRTCNGMKDYCGGPNQWTKLSSLADAQFILRLAQIQAHGAAAA